MNRFASFSVNSIQKKSEFRRTKKDKRIIVNLNIDMKSEKKVKELNDEYFEEKLENSKFESKSKSLFKTSNLFNNNLFDNKSNKSIKS